MKCNTPPGESRSLRSILLRNDGNLDPVPNGYTALGMIDGVLSTKTSAGVETPVGSDNEGAANSIIYDPAITGLTGGGATKLDGIATTGLQVGTMVLFSRSGLTQALYRLTATTSAEDSPFRIRPDDYDGSTNAKAWVAMPIEAVNLSTPWIYLRSDPGSAYFQAEFTAPDLTEDIAVNVPDQSGTMPLVPQYADLSAANAAEAAIGVCFWDTTLKKLRVTTATS